MNKLFYAEDKELIYKAYTKEQIGNSPILNYNELLTRVTDTSNIEYLFSTWTLEPLKEEEIKALLPRLKCVFYGAGTVKYFAKPFLDLGIRVFSAAAANAIPVAQYCMAMVLLANKGVLPTIRAQHSLGGSKAKDFSETFPGNYNVSVGLVGCGLIARELIKRLNREDNIRIYVYDPYLTEDAAKELGVIPKSLDFIFRECQTISNHLPNLASLKGLIDYNLLSTMKDNATFINTGRPAQIDKDALFKVAKEKPRASFILDVTDVEPVDDLNSEYLADKNIYVTPHRAGSISEEIKRFGQYMFTQYENYKTDSPLMYEITSDMLSTIA